MTARMRLPIVALLGILCSSLGATVLLSLIVINLSMRSTQQVVLVMTGSGVLTTLVAYGTYRAGVFAWLRSIFWTMSIIVLVTVGLVIVNIWTLTQLMFISSAYLGIMSTVLIFVGVSALSFGYFTTRAMTDRLRTLSKGAQQLARGNLSTRLHSYGNDEIAQLTDAFNAMAHDLEAVDEEKRKLEQTRRNLVAWVSHDLRTPMTSMRVMLEALADGIITDTETRERYIQQSLGEISNLDQLIDNLFELAQLDIKDIHLDYATVSLNELLSDVVGALLPKAERKHISIVCTVASDADVVTIAPDKIQRVLSNLVDNAIKYTPPSEHIRILTHKIPLGIEVSVTNTGVHLPADQLARLFDSFYRGDSSRQQTDGERGAGLGLAIARGFVQAHGGTIHAASTPQSVTITFTVPDKKVGAQ